MLPLFALLAVVLYLAPLAVGLPIYERACGARGPAVVYGVPLVLGVDALAMLLVARLFPLGAAVWALRGAWLVLGVADRLRHRGGPSTRSPRDLVAAGCALLLAAGTVALTAPLSYRFVIWDRDWHVPLVSSLRAQTVPFANVFVPAPLRYHYLGDALAAALQSLSLGHVHAALALSLAHDVHLALLPVALFFVLRATGTRLAAPVLALAAACAPLAGPFSAMRPGVGNPLAEGVRSLQLCGNGHLSFLTLGYRPHTVVAAFYLTMFVALLTARDATRAAAPSPRWIGAGLVVVAGTLTLLDETSLGIAGLGLGVAWLLAPATLGSSRVRALVVPAACLAAIGVVTVVHRGALGPGGPVHAMTLHPARVLGLYGQPTLALTDHDAWKQLFFDLSPTVITALLALWVAARSRRHASVAVAALYATVVAISSFLWMRVDVNGDPAESQRFLFGAVALAPGVACLALAAAQGMPATRLALLLTLLAPSASSLLWYRAFYGEGHTYPPYVSAFGPVYTTDCVASTGPVARGAPAVRYVEGASLYAFAGCQPTRLPGIAGGGWDVAIHPAPPWLGVQVLRGAAASHPVHSVVCGEGSENRDRVCAWALRRLPCVASAPGSPLRECVLDAAARQELLHQF